MRLRTYASRLKCFFIVLSVCFRTYYRSPPTVWRANRENVQSGWNRLSPEVTIEVLLPIPFRLVNGAVCYHLLRVCSIHKADSPGTRVQ
jgi:hypothetical protein